jgi:dTDP-4-amino-4,6-dideoxygalactose transaminase
LVASPAARRLAESRPERRLGIAPGYPLPLARLPGFASRCVNAAPGFPGATELAEHLITLPTHSLLSAADLRALRRWMAEAVAA